MDNENLKAKALRIFETMSEESWNKYKDHIINDDYLIEYARENLECAEEEELQDFIDTYGNN